MEKENLFYQLGQLTYSYVRIDFFLSNIVFKLNLADEELEFFSNPSFERKLKKLSLDIRLKEDISNPLKEELLNLISEINILREDRNIFVHSIVLQTGEEFLFQSLLKKKNGEIERRSKVITNLDFENINRKFVDIHNRLVSILEKF